MLGRKGRGGREVLTLSYSSCLIIGLRRGQFLRRLSPVINGLDVQFQCRLFCMHRQMSFGVPAVLLEALCALPGGIGRFLPCRIGANHCRDILCVGHGLTSRPEDTSSVCFLAELLVLFGYPSILVMRCLPLRYCSKQVVPVGFLVGVFRSGVMWLISLLREVRDRNCSCCSMR